MTDTAPKPPSTGAIAAIISALPSEVRGILSVLLVFFAFYAMMYALINMPTYFKNLASSSSAKEQCWELREIQSAIFKFNRCDGSVSQVELKQSPATANTASKQ
jgi:hypothetical protein